MVFFFSAYAHTADSICMKLGLPSGGEDLTQIVSSLAFRAPGVPIPQVELADPMGQLPCK